MGTQGTGRKRNPNKERSTAEDDALNLIAREAEARLAAKRAARAEAREIRMKELERQQKELSDDDERMSVGSRGSVRVEDRDYLEKGSRAGSALTAATLTSLGGTSSRRGSGDTAITLDTEASIREIKDALVEVEEKYRKAMVSNAQLDNEKNNLMYQVDTLKDSLMELEELLSESRREYEEKVKEYEREKHAHSVLQFQFSEMKETLKQSEELLNKHGIVLGPDLNINGEIVEAETDGSSSGDPASRLAQDSQTSPTEGNSMLGSAEEIQVRSSQEEDVDPNQHQEMLEEAKESHLSSAAPCNLASVSTSREEEQACLPTVEDSVGENGFSKDSEVEMNDSQITETNDTIINNSEFEGIVTSPEEKGTGTGMVEMGDTGGTGKEEIGAEKVNTSESENVLTEGSDDVRETCNNPSEEQVNKAEEVEASKSTMSSTDLCQQQEATENNRKVSLPDDSTTAISNTEPQHKADNAEEAEESEEVSNKSQTQGAAVTGKKKKKKRRGKKKKGGTQDDENQNNDAKEKSITEKENNKTEKDVELATSNNEPAKEPEVVDSSIETLKESRMDQGEDDQDKQPNLETEEPKVIESVISLNTESVDSITNLTDSSKTPKSTDDHDGECTSNVDNSKYEAEVSIKSGVAQIESGITDSAVDEVGSVNDVKLDCTTENPENSLETKNSEENVEVESQDTSNADEAIDESESTNNSKSEDNKLVAPSSTDSFFDCLESLSGSEVPLESQQSTMTNPENDADIMESTGGPLEVTEAVKDEEGPRVEIQKFFSCTEPDHDNDKPELRLEGAGEEELNEELREDSLQQDDSSTPAPIDAEISCDGAFVPEKSLSETEIEPERFDDISSCPVESQDLNTEHSVDQNDESNAEDSLETEESDSIGTLQTADSAEKATEICSPVEQDDSDGGLAIDEDCQQLNSQDDQESEKSPSPVERQQFESSEDKPDDSNLSQPAQQDSEGEEDEDEEGQSFDFDDMDIEAAIATSDTLETPQDEVERGVEVMSEEDNNGNIVSDQCDPVSNEATEPPLETEEEPVESNEEKCTADESSKAGIQDELGSVAQDDSNSVDKEELSPEKGGDEQQNTVEKEVGVADESILEEAKVGNVGELDIVESNNVEEVNQELSLPVEQGEDAIKHELQAENLVNQKTEDKVASNIGKDSKQNSKKGKAKGKDECKMT